MAPSQRMGPLDKRERKSSGIFSASSAGQKGRTSTLSVLEPPRKSQVASRPAEYVHLMMAAARNSLSAAQGVTRVKPLGLAILLLVMAACGGSSKTTAGSGVKNRAFVTNAFSGTINIVDASTDGLSGSTIAAGAQPTIMALSPQREITAVFDSGTNTVRVVNNSTESSTGAIALPAASDSIVLKDSTTGFAAVRNASVNGVAASGAVVKLDTSGFTEIDCGASSRSLCVSVPLARTVVLSPDGSRLLVFSDNSNSVTIIDTTQFTSVQKVVSGWDRPVFAVFSSDSSKAFVLNCGPECGGTTASVQVLNVPSDVTQSSAGTAVPVAAATTALLNGNTLYVAGTPGAVLGAAAGRLNAFDVSSGAPVASGAVSNVPISDGYHTKMALASNNKLFIGARDCTNNPGSSAPTGCLTIFDTSANTAVIDSAADPTTGSAKGSVTGLAPIANRSVAYVVSGGEPRIYDTTTSAESTQHHIDIIGQAWDVKTVDQ
jgi:YVTN family beta-propeller protein